MVDILDEHITDCKNKALISAICENDHAEIKKMLMQGADPTLRDKNGNSALTYAFDTDDLNIINIFIVNS